MSHQVHESEHVPVYKYFTADLLTGDILGEIPFSDVSYERALKGAGKFSGKIPVISPTEALNLYDATVGGDTALYVVRDNICVWGGIIWGRTHNVKQMVMEVSASEFTSYFYHRKIWKTWNHQYGAQILVSAGVASAVLTNGSTSTLKPGSSIHLDFLEDSKLRYNGYYKVSDSPYPTTSTFYIVGAQSIVDIVSTVLATNVATISTNGPHGFSAGDTVTIDVGSGSPYNGTHTITSVFGSATDKFTYVLTGSNASLSLATGTATRPVPDGVYDDVTVTVRTDTYDYVRSLIDAVAKDFVGIDFPNVYIEPGISYPVDIINRELDFGKATITTEEPHGLSEGQAVQIKDLGPLFDGESEATAILSDTEFQVERGGFLASSPVSVTTASIVSRSSTGGFATFTTADAHGFLVGQRVTVDCGLETDSMSFFNGYFSISDVPTPTTFKVVVSSSTTVPESVLAQPTASVGANTQKVTWRAISSDVATLTTAEPHGFSIGNSVTVANINPIMSTITQKFLDSATSTATITTETEHELTVGDAISISGIRDTSSISRRTVFGVGATKTVKMLTSTPHNFVVGDTINISDMKDVYKISLRALASNEAALATPLPHNISTGTQITVAGLKEPHLIVAKNLVGDVATLSTSTTNNYQINDTVTVAGIQDVVLILSESSDGGVLTFNVQGPHNLFEGDTVTVVGIGAPYDGTFTILTALPNQIICDSTSIETRPPTAAHGLMTSSSSIFNGTYVIMAKYTDHSFSFSRVGNNVYNVPVNLPQALSSVDSILNGTYTVTSTPSANTLTYTRAGTNMSILAATEGSTITVNSVHLGARTITAVTRNSFEFQQALSQVVQTEDTTGTIDVPSAFNGSYTVTAVTPTTFNYTKASNINILETSVDTQAFVRATSIFNGTYTITDVDTALNTFSYARVHPDMVPARVSVAGRAFVRPVAIASTFGPYPTNANIGIEFSTKQYSGTNVTPTLYRGFELAVVGDVLNKYSDSINGFEYRIDCVYDEDTNKFRKIFVLIPIDFPNPPAPGEVSDPSRFGADKLVFEYPGNISDMTITESAEASSTRFFALGENSLGAGAGPPFSVAASEDLLSGVDGDKRFRRWPLLDEDEKVEDVDDETVLYAYARRYLGENKPPDAKITVEVNGSLNPVVGTYSPGDWCSLIVDDPFVQYRLASGAEPRDTVLVRKIDSFKVSVPNGTVFPERVDLTLIPEWEVDKRGK